MYPAAKQLIKTGFEVEGHIIWVGRVHYLSQKGTLFLSEGYIVCVKRVHYFELEGAVDYSFLYSFEMRKSLISSP